MPRTQENTEGDSNLKNALTTYVSEFLDRGESVRLYDACERLSFVRRVNPRNATQYLKRGTITFQDDNVGRGAAVLGSNHVDVRSFSTAPKTISQLRTKLTKYAGRLVNYVSINLYPDGASGIGFHNHKEDLEIDTPVLLVSVGSVRTMWMRRMGGVKNTGQSLASGSLFVMPSVLNKTHQHAILPEKEIQGVRYSLNCKCLELL
jgi:hypothetical protein